MSGQDYLQDYFVFEEARPDPNEWIRQAQVGERYCIGTSTIVRMADKDIITRARFRMEDGLVGVFYLVSDLNTLADDFNRSEENEQRWLKVRDEVLGTDGNVGEDEEQEITIEQASEDLSHSDPAAESSAVDVESDTADVNDQQEPEEEKDLPVNGKSNGRPAITTTKIPEINIVGDIGDEEPMRVPREETEFSLDRIPTSREDALAMGMSEEMVDNLFREPPEPEPEPPEPTPVKPKRTIPPDHKLVPPPTKVRAWRVGDRLVTTAEEAVEAWRNTIGHSTYDIIVGNLADLIKVLRAAGSDDLPEELE